MPGPDGLEGRDDLLGRLRGLVDQRVIARRDIAQILRKLARVLGAVGERAGHAQHQRRQLDERRVQLNRYDLLEVLELVIGVTGLFDQLGVHDVAEISRLLAHVVYGGGALTDRRQHRRQPELVGDRRLLGGRGQAGDLLDHRVQGLLRALKASGVQAKGLERLGRLLGQFGAGGAELGCEALQRRVRVAKIAAQIMGDKPHLLQIVGRHRELVGGVRNVIAKGHGLASTGEPGDDRRAGRRAQKAHATQSTAQGAGLTGGGLHPGIDLGEAVLDTLPEVQLADGLGAGAQPLDAGVEMRRVETRLHEERADSLSCHDVPPFAGGLQARGRTRRERLAGTVVAGGIGALDEAVGPVALHDRRDGLRRLGLRRRGLQTQEVGKRWEVLPHVRLHRVPGHVAHGALLSIETAPCPLEGQRQKPGCLTPEGVRFAEG